MRFLVLDGSRVLPALVRRLDPEAEIETACSLEEASRKLRADPPHAVIANLLPTDLPWEELCSFCRDHDPPIPVLFESCVFRDAAEAGIEQLLRGAHFLPKPYHISDLRKEIARLKREATAPARASSSPSEVGEIPEAGRERGECRSEGGPRAADESPVRARPRRPADRTPAGRPDSRNR